MSDTTGSLRRVHFIDGYRGIASMLIVIHHAASSNIARFLTAHGMPELGNIIWNITGSGVDMFFVISGLVILRPHLRSDRKFDVGKYFSRRFMRIYPTFLGALAFGTFVIWYINTFPTWYNEKGIHVMFSWMETFKQAMIFNIDGIYYNISWWSIAAECLVYLIMPLVIISRPNISKLNDVKVMVVVFVTIGASVLLQYGFDRFLPVIYDLDRIKLNIGRLLDYPLCFVAGALIAGKDLSKRIAYIFAALGVVFFMMRGIYLPMLHNGFALLWGALVIITFKKEWLQRVLSSPFFLWVGERSYSLYLVHLSVFYLMDNLAANFVADRGLGYGIITRGLGIPAAFLVTILLFNLIEKRFIKGLITDRMIFPWQYSKFRREE